MCPGEVTPNEWQTTNSVAAQKHNATGSPDTPMEVVVEHLRGAMAAGSLEDTKALVKKALDVCAGLDPYLESMTSTPPEVCRELIHDSAEHDWATVYAEGKTIFKLKREMSAGPFEGRFMKMLVQMLRAKRVLEVGMFTGTSTIAMAEALPDDGKIVALECEAYLKEFTLPYFKKAGVDHLIDVMIGPAAQSMEELKSGEGFDLIFIDADKGGYMDYYERALDMVTLDGIIAVDNTLMKGRPYIPYELEDCELSQAIKDFNEFVIADPRVEIITLPFRDGVTLIKKRKPSADGKDEVFVGVQKKSILQRMHLGGQVALITGAGQGIGRAFAHALGEAGAKVAIADMSLEKATEVADELKSKGIQAIAVKANVAEEKDCQAMVDATVAELGGLDIAINNAGINKNSAAEDTPMDEYDATFAVNTRGVFMCCQAEGRYMLKHGGGSIINTASMATLLVPHPQKQLVYNCSKAAVVKMTQTLACEWADRNVRVNCISPGIVNTALIQESEALRPLVSEWLNQIPAGRLAEVTDLQSAVVFMASKSSSYMTGHNLVLEGAQSLW